jgi:GNAT superfamily N-acetyltransferase
MNGQSTAVSAINQEGRIAPEFALRGFQGEGDYTHIAAIIAGCKDVDQIERVDSDDDIRRPWQRRGLARALLVQSLRAVRERGMQEAALGVDTQNLSGALNLYESVGFRAVKRWSTYRKPML